MNVYIGIDPSINSTGMTIRTSDGFVRFFIIKEDKLTKKEKAAAIKYADIFQYCHYEKHAVGDTSSIYERELAKAHNISCIADTIYNVIDEVLRQVRKTRNIDSITVCMEGISYGSIKSSAVMDLAGLNYLIRDRLHHHTIVGTLLVCPPAEIKKYATGQGNAKKELMIATFKGSYPELELPKLDDVCDSYFMSSFAQNWLENEYRNRDKS